MATDPNQMFEFTGKEYDWMMERFHTLIAKMLLVAARSHSTERALAKQVHRELIEFTMAFEKIFEEKGEDDDSNT